MNRVHLTSVRRIARAALAVALAGTAFGIVWPASAVDEDPAVTAARAEVDRLRSDLELAYLDVQRDHARVRLEEWARTPLADPFAALLRDFVKAARPQSPARTAAEDASAASEVLRVLAEKDVDPPLTPTSLRLVLVETARAARADGAAAERDLFVAAAKSAFAEARPEDSWDTRFLSLPVVAAFRAAQARLEAALKKPEPPPAPTPPAVPEVVKPEPATPKEAPRDPTDDMILCDRTRIWVGPWTGWTADIPEKQNKRQQRTVKAVWIDKYEVTCAQYLAFLATLGPSSRRAMLPQGWTMNAEEVAEMPEGRARHPVTGVTLAQAMAYAESVGKRLPTADEWERAAGGGEKDPREFPWGAGEGDRRYSHAGVEPKDTSPVDAFPDDVTEDGIAGMAGNAAELVATYTDRADIAKSGPEKGRQTFVCGGSFRSRASECGPAARWVMDDGAASPTVGFRCVMDDAEYRKRRK